MDELTRSETTVQGGIAARWPAWPAWFGHGFLRELENLFNDRLRLWWPSFLRDELLAMEPPPVDVFEEGDDVVVKAELPGMPRERIGLEVGPDFVIISGKKEKEEKVEKKSYYRFELSTGEFSRRVELPAVVEPEKATAQLKDGILELRAPKKAGSEPRSRKIEIG